MKITAFYITFLSILFFASAGICIDYYVNVVNGSNDNFGESPDEAWLTITHALSRVEGSTEEPAVINIGSGNYTRDTGEQFPLVPGYHVSLKGQDRDNTVISAIGSDTSVIMIKNVVGVYIESLTITGGQGSGDGAISLNITGDMGYYYPAHFSVDAFGLTNSPYHDYVYPGENLELILGFSIIPEPVTVDIYLLLENPSGELLPAPSWSGDVKPLLSSYTFPAGFVFEWIPIVDFILPSNVPPIQNKGEYHFHFAAAKPGTGDFLAYRADRIWFDAGD